MQQCSGQRLSLGWRIGRGRWPWSTSCPPFCLLYAPSCTAGGLLGVSLSPDGSQSRSCFSCGGEGEAEPSGGRGRRHQAKAQRPTPPLRTLSSSATSSPARRSRVSGAGASSKMLTMLLTIALCASSSLTGQKPLRFIALRPKSAILVARQRSALDEPLDNLGLVPACRRPLRLQLLRYAVGINPRCWRRELRVARARQHQLLVVIHVMIHRVSITGGG